MTHSWETVYHLHPDYERKKNIPQLAPLKESIGCFCGTINGVHAKANGLEVAALFTVDTGRAETES